MKTTTEAFEALRQRLELSSTEAEDARRRHKSVRDEIKSAFDVEGDFLTGSYARHTKTKPLKDVDIFFPLVGDSKKKWRDKAPSEVLDAFKECLGKAYGVDSVECGRRCVTVTFDKRNPTVSEDGKILSIDAVPAVALSDCYEIADGHLGRWIKSNPDVHATESTAKNKSLDCKWVLYTDIKTYLVELLMKQDQMSMAASIESRVPFLDHKLVEFTANIPSRFSVNGLSGKSILKEAVVDLLPRSVVHRQKMGFPTPWSSWLGVELNYLESILVGPRATGRALFKKESILRLFAEHRAGRRDNGNRIWRLLNLELWQQIFMDGDKAWDTRDTSTVTALAS